MQALQGNEHYRHKPSKPYSLRLQPDLHKLSFVK